ncbi:hypothetical protein ACFSOZ_03730 [Mesorhizobium newzealandense]|uniref:Transposase DDE domain-containing protein n=4 Tax=Mesorhizobium TaxID=68287 RepID=A0ABW4WGJ0_9HYPH
MPDKPVTAIAKLEIPHLGKKRVGFHLHRLRKQFARAAAKHIRQWIINFVGLTKANNVDSLVHGVSLSLRGSGRLRHPPRYAALLKPSSPSFRHSSGPSPRILAGFFAPTGDTRDCGNRR